MANDRKLASPTTSEDENPIIKNLKEKANKAQLQISFSEETPTTITGEEKNEKVNYVVIHPKTQIELDSKSPPSFEIKVAIPTGEAKVQEFYETIIPRTYFPLTNQLRELSKDLITKLILIQNDLKGPYLMVIVLSMEEKINEKTVITDFHMESIIESNESLPVFIASRVATIHSEGDEIEKGFIQTAKHLSPHIDEKSITPSLKKLILNKKYYQLFESKKLDLAGLSGIEAKQVDLLFKKQDIITRLVNEGLFTTKNLKNINLQYLKALEDIADIAIKHKVSDDVRELNYNDLDLINKMRKNTSDAEISNLITVIAALRKKTSPESGVTLFPEAKNIGIEKLPKEFLNLINNKIITLDTIAKVKTAHLSQVINHAEKIQNYGLGIQYLFASDLISLEQIEKIPQINLEQHKELKSIPKEILDFKPGAKDATDIRSKSFKSIITNFMQLAEDKLLDESDLYKIFKDPYLKNVFAEPKLKNLGTNPRLTNLCMESINRLIAQAMSKPKAVVNKETITETDINTYLNSVIANCEKWGLKDASELINKTRYATQILDVLHHVTSVDPDSEWKETEKSSTDGWGDDEANDWGEENTLTDEFDSSPEPETKEPENEFNGIKIYEINLDRLNQFIDKFTQIDWSEQEEDKLNGLQKELAKAFKPDKSQADSKQQLNSLQKLASVFDKLTSDNFLKSLDSAIEFANTSATAFAKPLEQLHQIINKKKTTTKSHGFGLSG